MTEQELNREFSAIRTFIEDSYLVGANPRRKQAIGQALVRLDRLKDKMVDLSRGEVRDQRPEISNKAL